jgi:hypothetical protein
MNKGDVMDYLHISIAGIDIDVHCRQTCIPKKEEM